MLNQFSLDDVCETVLAFPANLAVFQVCPGDRFVIRAMSQELLALYKTSAEIAIGMEVDEMSFTEQARRRLKQAYMECRDTRSTVTMDEELTRPDGFRVWTNRTVVPVMDADGAVVALISTVTDISELVVKRRALVRSLSTMASGFETICAWCRKISEGEEWISLEQYVEDHADSDVSLCPECQRRRDRSAAES